MKRVFSLLLSLFLFLPFVTLTGGLAEDDVVIEDLSDLDLQVDSDGKLVLGSERLSPEEIEKLNDLTAQVEFTEVDPADLYLNPNLPDNVINILLIGVDSRGTKDVQKLSDQMHYTEEDKDHKAVAKRSDVIMILSIDLDDGTIKLSSIARNTYVEIPDRTNKSIIANSFGHAIYKDGKYHSWIDTPAMCVATVNKNFQLNIQYYVAINFFGVEEIIEYLGGADIDLTKKEASAINTYLSMKTIYKKKNGEYVLNADGTKARASHGKLIASTYDNHSDNRKPLEKKDGVQHLDGLQAQRLRQRGKELAVGGAAAAGAHCVAEIPLQHRKRRVRLRLPRLESVVEHPRGRRRERLKLVGRYDLPQRFERRDRRHAELRVRRVVCVKEAFIHVGVVSPVVEEIPAVSHTAKRRGHDERAVAVEREAQMSEQAKRERLIRHPRPCVEKLVSAAPEGDAGVTTQRLYHRRRLAFEHGKISVVVGVAVAGEREFLPHEDSALVAALVQRRMVHRRAAP